MTIHEISNQLCSLAVGHCINNQKVSVKWLDGYISKMFYASNYKYCLLEIAMADGRFPCLIYKYSDKGYSYSIAEQKDRDDNFARFLHEFYAERNLHPNS